MKDGGLIDDSVSLGLRLQRARKSAGLTQQQLCQRAKLAYSTLAKIERGAIASPSIFTIQSIAQALNISLDTLIGNDITSVSSKKISKSGVRFIYFDINGCLVRFFHRAFTTIAEESNLRPDVIEKSFWHYNDAVCRGDITLEEFNQAMASAVGLERFDWEHHYLKSVEPIKEMQATVKWTAQHYQVGLLSNIMPGFIDTMRAQKLLPDITYDAIIDSSQVRSIKPEPEIFETAEAQAGVPATSILLVDDSRTNLMAVERMGWHVLWFDDFRPTESAERVKATLAF